MRHLIGVSDYPVGGLMPTKRENFAPVLLAANGAPTCKSVKLDAKVMLRPCHVESPFTLRVEAMLTHVPRNTLDNHPLVKGGFKGAMGTQGG